MFAIPAHVVILRMHEYLTLAVRIFLTAVSALLFALTYVLFWLLLWSMVAIRISQF